MSLVRARAAAFNGDPASLAHDNIVDEYKEKKNIARSGAGEHTRSLDHSISESFHGGNLYAAWGGQSQGLCNTYVTSIVLAEEMLPYFSVYLQVAMELYFTADAKHDSPVM